MDYEAMDKAALHNARLALKQCPVCDRDLLPVAYCANTYGCSHCKETWSIDDSMRPKMESKLARHILAMADDAYLVGHPEWLEIVKDAQKVRDDASAANAHLIAAAPTMLEALEAINDFWNQPPTGAGMDKQRKAKFDEIKTSLKAAIAQARGEK